MRYYPNIPGRRAAAIATDAAVLLSIVLFCWLGFKVHDVVDDVAVLGRGVESSGVAVQDGFASAAGAVENVPLVGEQLGGDLRDAGEHSGGEVAAAGREGEDRVNDMATLLGVLTFAIPTVLVLTGFAPRRVAQVRALTAASRALHEPEASGHRRLIAMRALFSLPYGDLMRHTSDPFGDLEAGRYEALLEAAYEDAGLQWRPTGW
jgi:hypothetical protein